MVRGEKAEIHRHADNLRVEGEFTGLVSGKSTEYKKHEQGERASVVKHTDNLKMEGSMAQRSHTTVGTVERSGLVKHQDNLRMEGKMENRQVGEAATRGERLGVIKREDNLKVGWCQHLHLVPTPPLLPPLTVMWPGQGLTRTLVSSWERMEG